MPLAELRAQNVFIVSGIAQPAGFVELVKDLGAYVQRTYTFPDHHRFQRDEVERIYRRAQSWHADAIVMTEKDAVRFPKRVGVDGPTPPVYYVKVGIMIKSGEEDFQHCIARICYP